MRWVIVDMCLIDCLGLADKIIAGAISAPFRNRILNGQPPASGLGLSEPERQALLAD